MIRYQVRFEKRAQKALKKLDKHNAGIIMAWIKKNLAGTTNPRAFGEGLTADKSGKWRYRIGDYRLITHIDAKEITILILEVGHRSDIYK